MGDARKNVLEGTSQSQGLNPPPDVSIWDANSLSRLVLASMEELLRRHPTLIFSQMEQPRKVATQQEK